MKPKKQPIRKIKKSLKMPRGPQPYTKWKTKTGEITKGAKARKFLTGGTPQIQIIKQTGIREDEISRIKRNLEKNKIEVPKYPHTKWKNSKGKKIKSLQKNSNTIKKKIIVPEKTIKKIKKLVNRGFYPGDILKELKTPSINKQPLLKEINKQWNFEYNKKRKHKM